MKKIIVIFLFFFITKLLVVAQQSSKEAIEPKDPKAKALLDELSKKNKSLTSMKIDFSYNLYNQSEKIDETQKGSIAMKNNKYILDIAGQKIVSNGKTQWTYIKDADEVQVDNAPDPSKKTDAINPAQIFSIYEDGFKYKYEKEELFKEKQVHIIKLFPIDANSKSYHTITLAIYKAETQLAYIRIAAKDGNKYTYYLDKLTANPALTDNDFNFDITKAGEVIDLR